MAYDEDHDPFEEERTQRIDNFKDALIALVENSKLNLCPELFLSHIGHELMLKVVKEDPKYKDTFIYVYKQKIEEIERGEALC